ncbi:hypothetical protein V5O48_001091 [Marasmius crinis-equi]|uniref:Uncharacterized protein n=1 Tax=Marasmius crinis-equi TaxID=585013 RepID=A0ABR3FZT7_9AGAR
MDPVTETVTITYSGYKASRIDPEDVAQATEVVREDAAALRLPQPPKSNITVIRPGTIEFFWETTGGSTLHKQLNGKLGQPASTAARALLEQISSLSIDRLEYHSDGPASLGASRTKPRIWRPRSSTTRKSLKDRVELPRKPDDTTPYFGQADQFLDNLGDTMGITGSPLPTPPSSAGYWPASVVEFPNSHPDNVIRATTRSTNVRPVRRSVWLKPWTWDFANGQPTLSIAIDSLENARDRHFQSQHVQPTSHPNSNVQKVEKLMSELKEVRRHLTAGLERQTDIVDELKRLSAVASVPPHMLESPANGMMPPGDELVLKARLKLAEQQLEEERTRRKAAEDLLNDVQRECKQPFVVPALLDAFVMISNLSSEAVLDRSLGT